MLRRRIWTGWDKAVNCPALAPRATLARGTVRIHPRARPPREPPFKFAFFSRLSY